MADGDSAHYQGSMYQMIVHESERALSFRSRKVAPQEAFHTVRGRSLLSFVNNKGQELFLVRLAAHVSNG